MRHKALEKLFALDEAVNHTKKSDKLFFNAMKEAFTFHYKNSKVYKQVCKDENFTPKDLKNKADLVKIPHIMVNVFKWYNLLSIPKEKIVATFTSSGTSGQKSHISWDRDSKERQSLMRSKIMQSYNLVSDKKVNYLIFAYAPEVSESKGAAYAHQMYSTFAPANEKFFAIHADKNGEAVFNQKECVDKLIEFAKSDLPIRIIGFAAFMHQALLYMQENDIIVNFPKDSLVITAGGWKNMADKAISIKEFEQMFNTHLGISAKNIRDVFGFVEHGVPYISCEAGHFHVPIYAKAYTLKPGTLEVLAKGQKGLLQVLSPYNYAQPALSVLATDYAKIGDKCSCGRDGDYIELLGRAGLSKHQGCAISATELLKK